MERRDLVGCSRRSDGIKTVGQRSREARALELANVAPNQPFAGLCEQSKRRRIHGESGRGATRQPLICWPRRAGLMVRISFPPALQRRVEQTLSKPGMSDGGMGGVDY